MGEIIAGGCGSAQVLSPARLRRPGRRPTRVLAGLGSDAVWVQEIWALHRLPLADLMVERGPGIARVTRSPAADSPDASLTLEVRAGADGKQWLQAIEAGHSAPSPVDSSYVPDGVSLVRSWPIVPYSPVGWIEHVGRSRRAADQGLRLRAGAGGADAVLRVRRQRVLGSRSRRAYGLAVRVPDPVIRTRLRRLAYAEQVRRLAGRMLVVLAAQAILLVLSARTFGGPDYAAGPPGFAVRPHAAWVGALLAWPVLLAAALWVTRWPGLLRAAGLAVGAATIGRGLAVVGAHLLVLRFTPPVPAANLAWLLVNPVDWLLMVAGLVLAVRAWRLAAAARDLLPGAAGCRWMPGTLFLTAVYAMAVAGWAERAAHDAGARLVRPGVHPVREWLAVSAYGEGVNLVDRGELIAAERWLRDAVWQWERLTERPGAPPAYHARLALTHHRLGLLLQQQGREDEAAWEFTRAAEIGTGLGDDVGSAPDLPAALAECRHALADWRGRRDRIDKDRTARDLCEAGLVGLRKHDPAAEGPFRQAIALWEELLGLPLNAESRKAVLPDLARAYGQLAQVYEDQGRVREAQAALEQAIARGEQAVALGPDRPLIVKDNLEVAREDLDRLRERDLIEETDRLIDAGRWADAAEVYRRGVTEQEARVRANPGAGFTTRPLASRLDRLARFLANCPDDAVRDTAAAVRHARRAAELHPAATAHWYTLAMAQYRDGRWRDSLAALEELKARGEPDAGAWFFAAMSLHRLGRPADARAAFRKGTEWMDRHERAGGDWTRQAAYELLRPHFEALRREAERLLTGKDPSGDRIGWAGRRKSETGRPPRTDRLAGSFPNTLTAAGWPGTRSASRQRPTGRKRRSGPASRSRR